jgi:predicted ester cyclase
MTWSGTHRGRLQDVEPSGERVEYVGVAIFRLEGGRIEEVWVVGDTQECLLPSALTVPTLTVVAVK